MKSVSSRTATQATSLVGATGPAPIVKTLSKFLPKSPKDMGRLQKRFSTAGLHGPAPVAAYLIGEVVLAIVGSSMIPLYLDGLAPRHGLRGPGGGGRLHDPVVRRWATTSPSDRSRFGTVCPTHSTC